MKSDNLLKLSFILLIIQNLLWFTFLIADSLKISEFLKFLFIFDLLCYLILIIAMLMIYKSTKKIEFIVSSVFFAFWIADSLLWRLQLDIFSGIIDYNNQNNINQSLSDIINLYIMGGLFFLIGIFFLSRGMDVSKRTFYIALLYGIVNIIALLLTLVGVLLKITVVPILGIITYFLLLRSMNNKTERPLKEWKTN